MVGAIGYCCKRCCRNKLLLTHNQKHLQFRIKNYSDSIFKGTLVLNPGSYASGYGRSLDLKPYDLYVPGKIELNHIIPGTNEIVISGKNFKVRQQIVNWNVERSIINAELLDLSKLLQR